MTDPWDIIATVESDDLDKLIALLSDDEDRIRKLTFCIDGGLKVKVNEDVWTLPLGRLGR